MKDFDRALVILRRVQSLHVDFYTPESPMVADDFSRIGGVHARKHRPDVYAGWFHVSRNRPQVRDRRSPRSADVSRMVRFGAGAKPIRLPFLTWPSTEKRFRRAVSRVERLRERKCL